MAINEENILKQKNIVFFLLLSFDFKVCGACLLSGQLFMMLGYKEAETSGSNTGLISAFACSTGIIGIFGSKFM